MEPYKVTARPTAGRGNLIDEYEKLEREIDDEGEARSRAAERARQDADRNIAEMGRMRGQMRAPKPATPAPSGGGGRLTNAGLAARGAASRVGRNLRAGATKVARKLNKRLSRQVVRGFGPTGAGVIAAIGMEAIQAARGTARIGAETRLSAAARQRAFGSMAAAAGDATSAAAIQQTIFGAQASDANVLGAYGAVRDAVPASVLSGEVIAPYVRNLAEYAQTRALDEGSASAFFSRAGSNLYAQAQGGGGLLDPQALIGMTEEQGRLGGGGSEIARALTLGDPSGTGGTEALAASLALQAMAARGEYGFTNEALELLLKRTGGSLAALEQLGGMTPEEIRAEFGEQAPAIAALARDLGSVRADAAGMLDAMGGPRPVEGSTLTAIAAWQGEQARVDRARGAANLPRAASAAEARARGPVTPGVAARDFVGGLAEVFVRPFQVEVPDGVEVNAE